MAGRRGENSLVDQEAVKGKGCCLVTFLLFSFLVILECWWWGGGQEMM